MPLPNNCPLCNASSNNQVCVTTHVYGDVTKQRAFYNCLNCDVYYQFPRLTKKEEEEFYTKEFENYMDNRSLGKDGWSSAEEHVKKNKTNVSRRMKYIKSHLKNVKNVLDIGCSSGFMLYPLMEKGIKCYGIEPSGAFGEYCLNNSITLFENLDCIDPNYKFDLIMHFFVLEHIIDPLKFLKKQIDLLNDGGKIIIEIPNAADPLYSIYDIESFERFYWSIAHPWYFTEKSVSYLLDKLSCNYNIILDQRYDLSNHMVWMRDRKPGGMNYFSDHLGIEFEEEYKKHLIKIKKTDTIVIIIKKN